VQISYNLADSSVLEHGKYEYDSRGRINEVQ